MFLVVSLTIAIFLILFINVAISPKVAKILLGFTGAVAFIGGLFFYGSVFATGGAITSLSVVQTCYITCLQFLGESPYEIMQAFMEESTDFHQFIMTALCFCGVFTTAGTAIAAIGSKFLRKLRVRARFATPLAIITPLNNETLSFARELIQERHHLVVFVEEAPDPASQEAAEALGCLVRTDEASLKGNRAFLKSIGVRKGMRKVSLYALSSDQFANRQYARDLLHAMQQQELHPHQTGLTIFANEDSTDNSVLCVADDYSFGTLMCISQEQMAARLLLQKSPIWDAMTFDENGRATCDFHALVIGSGKVGQAVVKQIVMNGQFAGSQFRLTIFDPNYQSVVGKLRYECGALFDEYDIEPHHFDARSFQMYAFLQENREKLRYIVVCTGNETRNLEIAHQLNHYLETHRCELPIHICSRKGLQQITSTDVQRWGIYSCQVLCSDAIDRKAMLLNNIYCGGTAATVQQTWDECNYFNRMSSRASADYAPAFLKMCGLDAVPTGQWYTPEQMENMAISEHERWCAFHYCMGFRTMTEDEFHQRCRIYLEEKALDPKTKYRISKDVPARIHRCLIPWEELDALSAAENAVTGGKVDYKQMDRDNVSMAPNLLASK